MKEYASPVELVKEFHTTYGQPIRTSPVFIVPEKAMRHDLIDEEIDELTLAFVTYDFVEVIDALADIVYVVCGAALTHGVSTNVYVNRPLVLGSFHKSLLDVEPLTDTERKAIAALWSEQDFEEEGILAKFEVINAEIREAKDADDSEGSWAEINRKLAERKALVGWWFEAQLDHIVSILENFTAANAGLHDAVNTDELKEGWLELIALSYGTAFGYGVDLDVVLEEVQASNLSKLAADGSVLRREDGKVLKGPNFFAPDILRVLQDFVSVSA